MSHRLDQRQKAPPSIPPQCVLRTPVEREEEYRAGEGLCIVFLLLILLFLRVHHTLELPIFVDESLHILRGRVVWHFSDLGESLLPKKLLYYYWIGLFGLDGSSAAWIARASSALLAMIGGALCYALARLLFGRRAGVMALALYTFTPMLVFFERLALADSMAASFGTAITISAVRLARCPTPRRGAITGLLIGLAALAKLTALPFAALPLLAIGVCWFGRGKQRPYVAFRPLILMVGGCLVVLAPSLLYVTIKEATGTADRVVVEQELYSTGDRSEQVMENLDRTGEAIRRMISPGLAGLMVIAGVILVWRGYVRTVVYLCGAALLPWVAIVLVSAELTTRYLVLSVPPLLVLVAGGWGEGAASSAPTTSPPAPLQTSWREGQSWASNGPTRVGWLVVMVWIGVVAGPFDWRAMTDPAGLRLPQRDAYEYVTSSASGYGLRELAADLPGLMPNEDGRIVAIGLLPSCHSLPLYWTEANAVDLKCPLFKWDVREKRALADRIVGWAQTDPVLYLALDEIGNLIEIDTLPVSLELVAVYPRPQDGDSIRLYRVHEEGIHAGNTSAEGGRSAYRSPE